MLEATPKVDAIVLAGTHQDRRRLVRGLNKAFLPLDGRLSLEWVLQALREAPRIGRRFVVGPAEELTRRVPPDRYDYQVVPESGRMLDNALQAYREAEGSHRRESSGSDPRDRPYLLLTSDIPLVVPRAVDDFIERCAAAEAARGEEVGLFPGLADEAALAPFYPRPPRAGIRRPYMELRHQRLRLANLYLARPRQIRNLEILQEGFAARKLTQWKSVLRLMLAFLKNPAGFRGAFHVACFQAASVLEKRGFSGLAAGARNRLELPAVERTAGVMLGCPFQAVVTPYGGASLDIDDESDYQVIRENFADWRKHQMELVPEFPEERAADGRWRKGEALPGAASGPGFRIPEDRAS